MSTTYKTLSQNALAATTSTDCYTAPALTQTVVSSIVFCNRGNTPTTFRLSIGVAGAALNVMQYLAFDVVIPANKPYIFTIGITLGAGDIIRAYAGNGNLSVSIFGQENA
jgi:hypothetical protein